MPHIGLLIGWLAVRRKLLRKLLTDLDILILSFSTVSLYFLPCLIPPIRLPSLWEWWEGHKRTAVNQSLLGPSVERQVPMLMFAGVTKDGIPSGIPGDRGKDSQWAESHSPNSPHLSFDGHVMPFLDASISFHSCPSKPDHLLHVLCCRKSGCACLSAFNSGCLWHHCEACHKSFSLQPAAFWMLCFYKRCLLCLRLLSSVAGH